MESMYLLGSVQAFFLDLLIANKKSKSTADKLLLVWLFLIGCHTLFFYGKAINGDMPDALVVLNACFPLLQGPFLYLYAFHLTTPKALNIIDQLKHSLPFVLFGGLALFVSGYVWTWLLITAVIFSGIFYIHHTFQLLKKYQEKEALLFLINTQWLKDLTVSMGVVWGGLILVLGIAHFSQAVLRFSNDLIFTLVSCFIFVIGFLGLKRGAIFANLPKEKQEKTNNNSPKYAQSGLKPAEMDALKQRLIELMQSTNAYTASDFSIKSIAVNLQVPPHYISQVLSSCLATNFYEFTNRYRIQKAKELMIHPDFQHLSILGIAYECGFNSKSTFNRAFKKWVGCPPSVYKKSYHEKNRNTH